MRPVIGVSAQPQRISKPYATLPYDGVVTAYVEAIRFAGGVPLVIPVLPPSDAAPVTESVGGLILSGGGDVHPPCDTGATVAESTGVVPARDAWEFALVRAALGTAVPLLGICRGVQVLCVAQGGSLDPHVGAVAPAPSPHLDPRFGHPVHIEPSSLLHDLVGTPTLHVNSLHHQAVRDPAPGQRPTAWAPDGTIEALEVGRPGDPHEVLALGVQWHPELLLDDTTHRRLFEWLVDAASRRRADSRVRRPRSLALPQ